MKEMWQDYSTKFLAVTAREQYLILLTGLVAIVFIFFTLMIEGRLAQSDNVSKELKQTQLTNKSAQTTIAVLEQSLATDPNVAINKQIAQYEQKLAAIDSELLLLTTDLINPIQMRYALIDLLKNQKNLSLLSFDIIAAQAMTVNKAQTEKQKTEKNAVADKDNNSELESEQSLTLYKHGIELKLKGNYFALKDYLEQLEKMDWQFFWQEFDYQTLEYPQSELTIKMYSLSTKKEFIGV